MDSLLPPAIGAAEQGGDAMRHGPDMQGHHQGRRALALRELRDQGLRGLAQADLGQMGITQPRINTIQEIARALMEGRVDFAVEQPLERFIRRWVQLPGIGEWTAHYIAMRVLKHPDAFPAADLILRREANPQGEPLSTKRLQALAESWRPWRAYSVMYLWRAATDSAAARKV